LTPEPPAVIACTVAARGRVAVAEPYLEPGPAIALGRRLHVPAGEGDLVLVEPRGRGGGRVVQALGSPDDVNAVMHALAAEAGVVRAEAPPGEASAPPAAGRTDRRGLLTFTVDPATARDFDDAVSVDGERLHVHIADVSAFVGPGSPVDGEAEERATSVYLPGRVDPMLPANLADGACSLVPGEDRLAVTVTLGPGDSVSLERSVIRSDHRLTYEEADAILAGAGAPAGLGAALRSASALAERLGAERQARGALLIDAPEPVFEIAGGEVLSAELERSTPAHRMIEQLMVRANERVAERLWESREPAIYRVHEPPAADALEALVERLEELEVPTPPMPPHPTGPASGRYAGLLSAAVARFAATAGRGQTLPSLVLRALERARYDALNLGHSGLASTAYCHFTSPIRRYPDLVCHRALLHRLGKAGGPADGDLSELAEHCSRREREAARLERRADDICLARLLRRRLYDLGADATFEGEVSGLIEGAVFVRFDGLFEGLLPARALGDDWFALDRLGVAMVGSRTGSRLRLADPLTVRVRSADAATGRVLLDSSPV
jgi:ribonuclease R